MKKIHGIRLYAICISVIISIWCIYQDSLINNDGILYLLSAELISQGEWQKALQLYNWLFYSVIIAALDKLTGAGIENAAYIINTALQALIVYSFISIIKEAGGNQKHLVASALLILIYSSFNEYRSYIVRDFGYWAFYLLSIQLFILYTKLPSFSRALYWSVSMLTAFMFRVEGLIFYLLIPLFFLFCKDLSFSTRLMNTARLYILIWIAIPALAIAWLQFPHEIVEVAGGLSKPLEFARELLFAISSGLAERAEILRSHYLTVYSDGYAWSILIFTLLIILLTETIGATGFLFLALSIHAIYRKLAFPSRQIRPLFYYLILINIAVLSLFVITTGFIVGRYPVALVLTVIMAAPFSLAAIYDQWITRSNLSNTGRFAFPLAALLIVYMAVDGLISFGPGKGYIEQAGTWLRENTLESETVFSMDYGLLFVAEKLDYDSYLNERNSSPAGRETFKKDNIFDALENNDWNEYDYLAIRIKRKKQDMESAILKIVGTPPVKEFSNSRGDRLLIFTVSR